MAKGDIDSNYARKKKKQHKEEIRFIKDALNLLQKQAKLEEKITESEKERSVIIIDSEKNLQNLKKEMGKIRAEIGKTTKDYTKLVSKTAGFLQTIARVTKDKKGGLNVFSGSSEDAYRAFKEMTSGINKVIAKGIKSFSDLDKKIPVIANSVTVSINNLRNATIKTTKEIEKSYSKTHTLLSTDVQNILSRLKNLGQSVTARNLQKMKEVGPKGAPAVLDAVRAVDTVNELMQKEGFLLISQAEHKELLKKIKDGPKAKHPHPKPPPKAGTPRPPPGYIPKRQSMEIPDVVTGQGVKARMTSLVQRQYIRDTQHGGPRFNADSQTKAIKKLMGDTAGGQFVDKVDNRAGVSQSTALKEHLAQLKSGTARIQGMEGIRVSPADKEFGVSHFEGARRRDIGDQGQAQLLAAFNAARGVNAPIRGSISRDSPFGRMRNRISTGVQKLLPERRFREAAEDERIANRMKRKKAVGKFATKALGGSIFDSRISSMYSSAGDSGLSRGQKFGVGAMRAGNFAGQAGALLVQKGLTAGGDKSILGRVGQAQNYVQNLREEMGTEVVGQKAVYDDEGKVSGYEDVTQTRRVSRGEVAGELVKRGAKKALPLAGKGMKAMGKGLFAVFGKVAALMSPLAVIIEPLSEVLGAFGEIIGTAFIPLLQQILGLLFSEDMMAAMDVVVGALTQIVTLIVESGLLDLIADVLVFALQAIGSILGNEGFKSALKMFIEALMIIVNEVFKVLQPILPALIPILVLFAQLIGVLAKILAGLIKLLMPLIMVIVGVVINTIIAVINGIIGFVNLFLPADKDIAKIGYMPMSLDKQGVIEESGIAKVHTGEYVVKKEIFTEIMNETVVNNQFYGDYDNMARMSYEDSLSSIYSRRRR